MQDLTIVIVNWNGGPLLLRCLASIRGRRCSARVSVLVVDNNSTDGSREAASKGFPEFRVVDTGANLGFGRANNLARDLVDTPLILFLNPDTELMEDTLEQAIQCLQQHPDVGALGCRMLYPGGQVQELGLQWQTSPWTVLLELLFVTTRSRRYLNRWLPTIDPLRSGYVYKMYGGFVMAPKHVLDAVGWFDERYFMYAEDADLSRTLLSRGWKLFYCSEAAIVHVTGGATSGAPSTFSTLMKQESTNKLIRKHQGEVAALLHRIAVLLGGTVRLAAVLPAGVMAIARKDVLSAAGWSTSWRKHAQLVLWALGASRATIPTRSSQSRGDAT